MLLLLLQKQLLLLLQNLLLLLHVGYYTNSENSFLFSFSFSFTTKHKAPTKKWIIVISEADFGINMIIGLYGLQIHLNVHQTKQLFNYEYTIYHQTKYDGIGKSETVFSFNISTFWFYIVYCTLAYKTDLSHSIQFCYLYRQNIEYRCTCTSSQQQTRRTILIQTSQCLVHLYSENIIHC